MWSPLQQYTQSFQKQNMVFILPPKLTEVENGVQKDEFSLQMGYPLPWLSEKWYINIWQGVMFPLSNSHGIGKSPFLRDKQLIFQGPCFLCTMMMRKNFTKNLTFIIATPEQWIFFYSFERLHGRTKQCVRISVRISK